jgi:CBS domain-containing protein
MSARVTIADYMATDLLILNPEMEINNALAHLLEKNYSGAPVVDGAGKLIGVLSKKDCLKAALNASYYQQWGGTVGDYMSSEAKTLDADLDLVQAAELFLKSHYRRFPVLRDGRLVGQISRADLLRAMVEEWDFPKKAPK